MNPITKITCPFLIAIAFSVLHSSTDAAILGLNNLTGWQYNEADSGTPADLPDSDSIHLTTGNSQRRSIFFNTKQDITQFSASFTYRATNFGASLVGQGISLVLQNSAAGATALGTASGGLGYNGISNSAAIYLFGDTGPARTYNGFATGGIFGGGSNDTTPANAFNFRDINVTATYSGSVLTVTVDDPLVAGSPDFTRNYVVGNLATTIGSSTAYVGFGASTGDNFGNGGSNQYISKFRFGPVPEPTSALLSAVGGLFLAGRRSRKTVAKRA